MPVTSNEVEYICVSKEFLFNTAYVISVALQLAAGLLLVGNTATSRKGIIQAYCACHTGIAFEEDGTLADYSSLKNIVKMSWINKIAFSYLFAGYLVGVWGEVSANKGISFAIILILIIVLTVIPYRFAKYWSEHFGRITIDDIPKTGGVMYATFEPEDVDEVKTTIGKD